jgi:hypothetical protein
MTNERKVTNTVNTFAENMLTILALTLFLLVNAFICMLAWGMAMTGTL